MEMGILNNILSMALLSLLLVWIHMDEMINRDRGRRLINCVILTMIVIIAEMGCQLTDNTAATNRWLSIMFNAIGFFISPYILIYESKLYNDGKKRVAAYIPAIINSIIVVLSPFTHWIFYVTEQNTYYRGKLFFIYLLIISYSMVYSCVIKFILVKRFPPYFRKMILISSIFVLVGGIIQVIYPEYHTTWLIMTMYLILYYAFSCTLNSMQDSLTGLLNRTAYDNQIQYLLKAKKSNVVVFMVDVNDFKDINDTKGHAYGDFCLQEVAKMLKKSFSENAQVFRYGGDEFCIIAYLKSAEEVKDYIGRIERLFKENLNDYYFMPNISIGYDVYGNDGSILDTVEEADRKMYKNKKESKMADA